MSVSKRSKVMLVGIAAVGAMLATAAPLVAKESTGSSALAKQGGCSRPNKPNPQKPSCQSPAPFPTTGTPSATTSLSQTTAPSPTASPTAPESPSVSPSPSISPLDSSGSDTTAAGRYGWTNLVARSDFAGSTLDSNWGAYDSAGHGGDGVRSPAQISLSNGVLRMTGTADGKTAGMYWKGSQKYGRWEIRARFPAGCSCYHPVLLLWPSDNDWPVGGEVDYAEVFDGSRQKLHFFLHYSADNKVIGSSKLIDMTQWHNFAVEWTADHITGYVDGQPFFHTTQSSAQPPGPMYQAVQLDWFPNDTKGGATLEVDWATKYKL